MPMADRHGELVLVFARRARYDGYRHRFQRRASAKSRRAYWVAIGGGIDCPFAAENAFVRKRHRLERSTPVESRPADAAPEATGEGDALERGAVHKCSLGH